MAETTTTDAAVQAPQLTDAELEALLIKKDDAPQATETAATPDAAKAKTDEAAELAKKDEAAAPNAATESNPQPGTADKALQKMQQDLAASDRKLDALLTKVNAGQQLSQQEKQQAQQAQRKIDSIRAAIQANSYDTLEHGTALAESLIEQDQTVTGLVKQVGELSKQLSESRSTTTWSGLEKQYPGVDVYKAWDKCVAEAGAVIGTDNPQLQNLANTYFHQRCDIAAKSVAAKTEKKPPSKAPVTPNGANPTLSTGAPSGAAPNADAEYEARAMSLVKSET